MMSRRRNGNRWAGHRESPQGSMMLLLLLRGRHQRRSWSLSGSGRGASSWGHQYWGWWDWEEPQLLAALSWSDGCRTVACRVLWRALCRSDICYDARALERALRIWQCTRSLDSAERWIACLTQQSLRSAFQVFRCRM